MYRRIIMVAIAVAAIVLGAIAISEASPASHRRPQKRAAVVKVTSTRKARSKHHAPGTLLRRFAILRSANAASATPLPRGVEESFTKPGTETAAFELEPAETRSLNVDGTQVWVTPGAKGLCVTIPDPPKPPQPRTLSGSCGTLSQMTNGSLLVSREPSGPVLTVYGLVPDGDSVTITSQDGSHTAVPVASNFFAYHGGASARSVSIDSADGTAVETENLVG